MRAQSTAKSCSGSGKKREAVVFDTASVGNRGRSARRKERGSQLERREEDERSVCAPMRSRTVQTSTGGV